jgi:hypothetical protein
VTISASYTTPGDTIFERLSEEFINAIPKSSRLLKSLGAACLQLR